MSFDIDTLEALRRQHPAWRLLQADSAALVASFLHRVFVLPNRRVIHQAELASALDDTLYAVREQRGPASYPKPALEYLNDWAANDKAWLRKFYPPGSDEPHFDLTPATEKALAWVGALSERNFVGTESRLLTLFELLRQMDEGSQTDPEVRIQELQRRRDAIDGEIERVRSGDLPLLGDTALKERFTQFATLAGELLADFREVEHNFRGLDRRVRERIALWDGSKGALLQDILGERDLIDESDQGRSFRAFWDFLMSRDRQDELSALLDRVLRLEPVAGLAPNPRLRRVHYDWLEAGEQTQRTVALLSQQLRRFLDDQAFLENRRIMDILRGIEAGALAVRAQQPAGEFMRIDDTAPNVELPMERPLHAPAVKLALTSACISAGDEDLDAAALYSQFIVDKAALAQHVRRGLQQRTQVTLTELLESRPLRQGLAELVAYLSLATEPGKAVIDDSVQEQVSWLAPGGEGREGREERRAARRSAQARAAAARDLHEMTTMADEGQLSTHPATELSAVLIPLLKGVSYRADDATHWSALLELQGRVRDHVAVLGLELMLDEAEGYAFLRSRVVADDDPAAKLPRLVARRPLSFPVSLLLALLRKKLAEFDAGGGDTRLILSREQVAELLRVFMPEGSNEARLIDQVDTQLNKLVELGFVRRLRGQDGMFEVQRILKAFVDAQWLGEFDARLAAYRAQLAGSAQGKPEPGDEE